MAVHWFEEWLKYSQPTSLERGIQGNLDTQIIGFGYK